MKTKFQILLCAGLTDVFAELVEIPPFVNFFFILIHKFTKKTFSKNLRSILYMLVS